MTSGPDGTVLYLDGKPLRPDRYQDLVPETYSGQLLMDTRLQGEQGWRGIVVGLALYERAFSAQVADALSFLAGEPHGLFRKRTSALHV